MDTARVAVLGLAAGVLLAGVPPAGAGPVLMKGGETPVRAVGRGVPARLEGVPAPAHTGTQEPPGVLEGTVILGGASLPAPTRVVNSTDPEVCGTEHSLHDMVVSRDTRGVRWVIVSLVGVPEDRVPDRSPGRLVIDNRSCQFVPHAAVAVVGDTVVALNSDPTLHNTHYYGPMRSNVVLVRRGTTVSRVARRRGLVTVLCDVHGWMKAHIRIDPHPFHAVTDAGGRFRIEGIPPGTYALELWHERLGKKLVDVEIRRDQVTSLRVEYTIPDEVRGS